jgi:hypothetical protein
MLFSPKSHNCIFEICAFILVSASTVSIMPVANSTTTNAYQQWATLANQQDFWKA